MYLKFHLRSFLEHSKLFFRFCSVFFSTYSSQISCFISLTIPYRIHPRYFPEMISISFGCFNMCYLFKRPFLLIGDFLLMMSMAVWSDQCSSNGTYVSPITPPLEVVRADCLTLIIFGAESLFNENTYLLNRVVIKLMFIVKNINCCLSA